MKPSSIYSTVSFPQGLLAVSPAPQNNLICMNRVRGENTYIQTFKRTGENRIEEFVFIIQGTACTFKYLKIEASHTITMQPEGLTAKKEASREESTCKFELGDHRKIEALNQLYGINILYSLSK